MLEWLTQLVQQYGLIGLFFSSFLGSTIFVPFTIELTFPLLLEAHIGKLAILWFASAGSLCGTLINYGVGYQGVKYAERYIKKEDMEKAHKLMNKYGWFGLFTLLALPLPLPVDPFTIIAGGVKMHFMEFSIVVFTAKVIKYALMLGVIIIVL
jgi:membrane protein YqaA with SNARE-associated domain